MKRIGLISDTHSYLDERLLNLFADVDEIWHAGDIGDVRLYDKLLSFKPLHAVYGNVDDRIIRSRLPEIERFTCEDVKVIMMHIGGYPGKYEPKMIQQIIVEKPKIVISGHSHILKVIFDKKYNCLHLNPGACGMSGFHFVRTALRFAVDGAEIKDMEVIELGSRR